jgi:hypothetical protein
LLHSVSVETVLVNEFEDLVTIGDGAPLATNGNRAAFF